MENGVKTQINVPQRLRIDFFTEEGRNVFSASRDGDNCTHCSVSSDKKTLTVHLSLRDHPIGCGRLLKVVTEITADAKFPDGERHTVIPGKVDVILYKGNTGDLDVPGSEIIIDDGIPGRDGTDGLDGKSAYEIAVEHGFVGTEEEWLASLAGGPDVVDNLEDGGRKKALSAEQGKRIYEIIKGVTGGMVDPMQYTQIAGLNIDGSGKYVNVSGVSSTFIPRPAQKVKATAPANKSCVLAVVTTSEYQINTIAPFAAPYTNRVVISPGQSVVMKCNIGTYLWCRTETGTEVAPPTLELITDAGLEGRIDALEDKAGGDADALNEVREEVFGQPGRYGVFDLQVFSYKRIYAICNLKAVTGMKMVVKLNDYDTYQFGVDVQLGTSYSSSSVSSSGFLSADLEKTFTARENDKFIKLVIRRANDGALTLQDAINAISEISYYIEPVADGLVHRVAALENAEEVILDRFRLNNKTALEYYGQKISLAHPYTYTYIGRITGQAKPLQGGAVYGNLLFQFEHTNVEVIVYDLSTAQIVQRISQTAMPNTHCNNVNFGPKYDEADEYPCLYVNSEGTKQCFVYRILGEVGNMSLTLVQTINFGAINFYFPQSLVDVEMRRLLLTGYTRNSWKEPASNSMVGYVYDLPALTDGEVVTLGEPYHEFGYPFLYAQQGSFVLHGKIYEAFGSTQDGLGIGGLIVYDYIKNNLETYLNFKPMGNFEPESLSVWNGSLVICAITGHIWTLTV